jgi:hypothetical protein
MRDVTTEEAELFLGLLKKVEESKEVIPWPNCLDCEAAPYDVWLRTEDISSIFTRSEHVVHMTFDPCGHTFRMQLDPVQIAESA